MYTYINNKRFTNLMHLLRIRMVRFLLSQHQYVSFVTFSCLKVAFLYDSVAPIARRNFPIEKNEQLLIRMADLPLNNNNRH